MAILKLGRFGCNHRSSTCERVLSSLRKMLCKPDLKEHGAHSSQKDDAEWEPVLKGRAFSRAARCHKSMRLYGLRKKEPG